MRGVQLIGDLFTGGSPPSKLLHDRSFFRQIGWYVRSHRVPPGSMIRARRRKFI
jgi:hypothetical protein